MSVAVDVSRKRKPLTRLQGLQQRAPHRHRDAAAGRVRRRREQHDAAAWREAPTVRTGFEGSGEASHLRLLSRRRLKWEEAAEKMKCGLEFELGYWAQSCDGDGFQASP